jgi:hypothetical protein
MFTFGGGKASLLCQRREFLRVGSGLAAAGFTLPSLLLPQASAAAPTNNAGRAKSCILVYLLGGPPHQDMFDLKPEASAEVRGPFEPISTNVPGTQICEHLPQLAQMADRYALLRSVSHNNHNHTPMIYYTLTGRETEFPAQDNDVRPPQRADFPHTGAVIAKFRPSSDKLPAFISLPELATRSSTEGVFNRGARMPLRGGGPGFLGPRYEGLNVNGAAGSVAAIPALNLPEGVDAERFERRAALLGQLDQRGPRSAAADFGTLRQSAIALTGAASGGNLETFSLAGEPTKVRERYGTHRFGQTMLLARRLVEAGVPMVAIHWNEMTVCDGWDTHSKNFEGLKSELLPMLDQGLSALLDDLQQRGLIDQTLVACFGEFGRTPKINGDAGRDHWGSCSTTLLAGGGIRGGQVWGASDKTAAFPARDPVDPIDIQATMYHCLGLDPQRTVIYDSLDRPLPISEGRVLKQLF